MAIKQPRVLSTFVRPEMVALLKEKVSELALCGVENISVSSLAAAFLESKIDELEELDPRAFEDLKGGTVGRSDMPGSPLCLYAGKQVGDILRAKVKLFNLHKIRISLSSLISAFLESQMEEMERIDPAEMAADMIESGFEPDGPAEDEDPAEGEEGGSDGAKRNNADTADGREEAGEAAEGAEETEGGSGKDEGPEAEGQEEGGEAPAGEPDGDGDEEVLAPEKE